MIRRVVSFSLLALATACAPQASPSALEPEIVPDTFVRPLLRSVPVPEPYRAALARRTRSSSGAPGAAYWQQRVSYRIDAELDPASRTLHGRERIVYRNRSPDTLSDIVLNLYQNVFSAGVPRNRAVAITGGITLESVAAEGRTLEARPGEIPVTRGDTAAPVGYAVDGTLARIVLPRPLAPGDSASLEIAWRYTVPAAGAFRTAWEDALGGRVFQVAQWYPQIAVYDDLRGWDATPYLGDGEFYLEYGDYEVALTLPAGWLVGATGELRNPEEVLTDPARRRLRQALTADSTVHVVTEADLAAGRVTRRSGGTLTWRFAASDVRDFAWIASDGYLWDVTRAPVGGADGDRYVPVHALYRPGAPGWREAARYGRHAVSFFSDLLLPYPYPQLTVSEGPIYGMEYPQLVFIARPEQAEDLYAEIAHEIGHEWFPMLVGQDEARYAWMDEGFTTFHEDTARAVFYPGSDPWSGDRDRYLRVAGSEREVPLMRHTDLVDPYGARTVAAYSKPGTLLRSLRAVVGDSVFTAAMRTYAREWRLKHPTPWDFFATVERVSGRDLDWFWYPWWWETGTLDQAIASVEQPDSQTVTITVVDLGEIPVPTRLVVTAENGATTGAEVPIEVWTTDRRREATLSLPVLGRVVRVEIDPEQVYPDVDRENNIWVP